MIVTSVLLAMVWYIVWGFVFIIPLAYLLFFGLVDGVFWAGMFILEIMHAYDSDFGQIRRGSMVPIHGSSHYGLFYVFLEMGSD
jgi:hypothetical protein